jgi:hypothetical protein
MKILEKEDIYLLIEQNQKETGELDLIKKQIDMQPTDFSQGAFDRNALYKAVLFEDMHKDGFVMQYPHGMVVRQSDRNWYYRGESACYPTSQPTFIRKLANKSQEEREVLEFVANLRFFEFFKLLEMLDHYHNFRNIHFTKGETKIFLDVLFYNIAQHYGFDTNWLDITSDFETALFFACCKYSDNNWRPLTNRDFHKSKYGRIFRRPVNDFRNMFPKEKYVVLPIGFQPFMRCHMQYSYGIAMEEGMDLNNSESGFECLKFRHSEELSNYIFTKMSNGDLIYPHEGLRLLSDELNTIQNCKNFSLHSFQSIYQNLNFNYSEIELKQRLEKWGIAIGSEDIIINQTKIDLINEWYENFDIEKTYNLKLRTRLTYSP